MEFWKKMFSNLPIWFCFILYVSYKKESHCPMGCVGEIDKKYFVTNIDKYKNTMQHSAKNSEVDIWRKTMIFYDKVQIF